ncbi:MAG: SOS response-associated peptidase [Bacteroidales bacterium]|jgi:putative SOS response-associated peptidase YedK|nr:SOS response-associated peptidase [Bacteroidales bacterium]
MCFTVSVEKKAKEAIREYLKSNAGVQMPIDFNEELYLVSGFSHPLLHIIREGAITLSEWGLIPSFAVEENAGDLQKMTLNARADTIYRKPSYKESIVTRRCILVVDGFFEWRHENNRKYPYYIYPKDETVFYLGCIYNSWVNKVTGQVRDTFSIITTDANPLMEMIHNTKKRMPLILHKEDLAAWINPATPKTAVDRLMVTYPESGMSTHTISSDAGNPRKNRNIPEIKEEMRYPERDTPGQLFV